MRPVRTRGAACSRVSTPTGRLPCVEVREAADRWPLGGVRGWRTASFQEHVTLRRWGGGAGHPHFEMSQARLHSFGVTLCRSEMKTRLWVSILEVLLPSLTNAPSALRSGI